MTFVGLQNRSGGTHSPALQWYSFNVQRSMSVLRKHACTAVSDPCYIALPVKAFKSLEPPQIRYNSHRSLLLLDTRLLNPFGGDGLLECLFETTTSLLSIFLGIARRWPARRRCAGCWRKPAWLAPSLRRCSIGTRGESATTTSIRLLPSGLCRIGKVHRPSRLKTVTPRPADLNRQVAFGLLKPFLPLCRLLKLPAPFLQLFMKLRKSHRSRVG